MIELTEKDILERLKNTEDSTVERKAASDYRDCLKTAVAFSNSLPIGDPGIIFVGVYNDGRVPRNHNFDSLQQKVTSELSKVYPPIYPQLKVMSKDGEEFLAVIVRGSPDRPHFAGQAYIRSGSETVNASDVQFGRLIAERNSKAREILKWSTKAVSFRLPQGAGISVGNIRYSGRAAPCRVIDCNQFFVTVEFGDQLKEQRAYPLAFIEISFDCEQERLELVELQS
jgi:hypothetical protein